MSQAPTESVQTRTLRRAAETLGGVDELAALLNTPEEDIQRWIIGVERPPQVAFLKALDIVAYGRSKP
jgi:hypothetical protein